MSRAIYLAFLILPCFALILRAGEGSLIYPKTKRVDQFDDYHGVKVADPYRWLEGDVRKLQGGGRLGRRGEQGHLRLSRRYSRARRHQETAHRPVELREDQCPDARRRQRTTSSARTTACKITRPITCRTRSSPNRSCSSIPTPGARTAPSPLAGYAFSEDGKYLAYGTSEAGSDWNTWKVMDVASRKVLDDELRWIKFSGASWTARRQGLLYSRFPEPKAGRESSRGCRST